MAKGVRKCKVCGCEYEYCHTIRAASNVFRYQDVACCPEHGEIYLAQILKSRAKDSAEETTQNPEEDIQKSTQAFDAKEQVQIVEEIDKAPNENMITVLGVDLGVDLSVPDNVEDAYASDEVEKEKQSVVNEDKSLTRRKKSSAKKVRTEAEEISESGDNE